MWQYWQHYNHTGQQQNSHKPFPSGPWRWQNIARAHGVHVRALLYAQDCCVHLP
jgi:hypothetical protein